MYNTNYKIFSLVRQEREEVSRFLFCVAERIHVTVRLFVTLLCLEMRLSCFIIVSLAVKVVKTVNALNSLETEFTGTTLGMK